MLVYRCTGQIQVGKFSKTKWQLPSLSGEGNGNPLQYSCLDNPMDGGAWWVHGVANSRTRLSNFTFTFHFHALEKEMATHSSVLAWRIPGTGKPGGLPSTGSHRVGHDWSNLAAAAAASLSSHYHTFRHRLKYVPYSIKTYLPRVFPAAILVKNWHTYIVLSW